MASWNHYPHHTVGEVRLTFLPMSEKSDSLFYKQGITLWLSKNEQLTQKFKEQIPNSTFVIMELKVFVGYHPPTKKSGVFDSQGRGLFVLHKMKITIAEKFNILLAGYLCS